LARLSDAELLDRLEWLQEELRWLHDQIKARLSKPTRRKPNSQWHRKAIQDALNHDEAPHNPAYSTEVGRIR